MTTNRNLAAEIGALNSMFDDYLKALGIEKMGGPLQILDDVTPESNVPYQQREDYLESIPYQQRPDYQKELSETVPPPPAAGRYLLPPGEDALVSLPGRYGLPGEDMPITTPNYKPDTAKTGSASIKKSSLISSLKNQLARSPAVEPGSEPAPVDVSTAVETQSTDLLGDRQAQLAAALEDRQRMMSNSALRGASTDFLNAGLIGIGSKHKFTPGYAHEELKRAEDLKLKDLNEDMALAGKVGSEEKAKQDLENMQALNDPNSPQTVALRKGVAELLGDRIPADVLAKMSGKQLHDIVGKDLASIITSLEDRKLREQQMEYTREDRALNRQDRALDRQLRKMRIEASILDKEEKRKEKADKEKSKGFEVLDKDYVKEYNDWTSNGRPLVEKNFQLLDQSSNALAKHKNDLIGTSGRVTGRLPDLLRSEESIRIRDDVHAAAVAALKATLGAQFTEREGERIKEMSYNEKLSPAENLKKIEIAKAFINQLAKNNNAKANHFETERTLGGYKSNTGAITGLSGVKPGKTVAKKQYSPSRNKTKIIYSDGTEEIVDGQK